MKLRVNKNPLWRFFLILLLFTIYTPSDDAFALDVPTGLTATGNRAGGYSQGSVVLTWTPVVGATGYAIQTSLNGTAIGDLNGVLGQASNNLVVNGLQGGSSYTFKIRSVSDATVSAWSTEVSATPKTSPSIPAKPTFTASLLNAIVRWTAPASDGGVGVTSYLITEVNSGKTQNVNSTTFVAQFNDFAAGAKIKFNVSANNGVTAEGSISANSDELTLPNVPNQVTGIAISKTSNKDELKVNWDVPGDGGTALTGFEVYLRQSGRDIQTVQINDITATTSTIAGLSAGSYSAQVLAKNIIGSGSRSLEPTAISIEGLPTSTTSGSSSSSGTSAKPTPIPSAKPTNPTNKSNSSAPVTINKPITTTALVPGLSKSKVTSAKIQTASGKLISTAKISISNKGKVTVIFPKGTKVGTYTLKIVTKNKKIYNLKVTVKK